MQYIHAVFPDDVVLLAVVGLVWEAGLIREVALCSRLQELTECNGRDTLRLPQDLGSSHGESASTSLQHPPEMLATCFAPGSTEKSHMQGQQ